jgi:hypothetical protein
MLWYRETDEWRRRPCITGRPGKLSPKAGTKWHLVDLVRSDANLVFAACDQSSHGGLLAKRAEVILEEATKAKPGMLIPTPGAGMNSSCSFCFRIAVRLASGGQS